MTTAVTTPNQLAERLAELAAGADMEARVLTRLVADGSKVYANVTCHTEEDAMELVNVVRAAREDFGPEGSNMTVRRDFRHLAIFLPVAKADAERGAQFLAANFRTELTEW